MEFKAWNNVIGHFPNIPSIKDGIARYKTALSKVSANWVAKTIMEEKDKSFVQDILDIIWEVTKLNLPHVTLEETPKNLSTVQYPGKDEIIRRHVEVYFKITKTICLIIDTDNI